MWERSIITVVHENRMNYDLMIDSASNWNEIREKLKTKGVTGIPTGISPLLKMKAYSQAPVADTKNCNAARVMTQKP